MDQEHLIRFEKILLQRQSKIRQALAENAQASRPVELDQSRQGRLSRMDALQGQAMAKATQIRREQELLRIKGALQRLKTEDYGLCFICGEPIALRRLERDPTVTRCVACAEE
ncbi:MAG TPA: TraR/DksA family transcriptional regulator [Halothiobacillaceae bacterium]|nr:TraR/DksA family transcriptional regulator [Halothiobacillaceae bacterium]